jgi:threonine dehydratase
VNGIHGETTGLIGGGGQYGGIHGLVKNLALRPVILGVSPVLASNDIVSFRGTH